MENKSVTEDFSGKSVFITGGSGFLGTMLIETLLRTCENIDKIYVLIRPKKGLSVEQRLAAITGCEIFEWAKQGDANTLAKIVGVSGDISSEGLALTSADYNTITENVSVIFHCAATIALNEPLLTALKSHLYGTRNVLQLARACHNLEVMIYVSTAFSNCNKTEVLEDLYKTSKTPAEIIDLMRTLNADEFNQITPSLMEDFPNTYTFSKAVTENFLQEEHDEIPIVIVRPSMILNVARGSMKGWIQGMTAFSILMMAHSKGLLYNISGHPNGIADIIPVDYVANAVIAAAWYSMKNRNNKILVYNIVSGPTNPLTWLQFTILFYETVLSYPPKEIAWYPYKKLDVSWSYTDLTLKRNCDEKKIAALLDFMLCIASEKPRFTKYVTKIDDILDGVYEINSRTFSFMNSKACDLFKSLSPKDQQLFNFDASTIKWDSYIEECYLGVRKYLMKDDITSVEEAKGTLKRLYWLHLLTKAAVYTISTFIGLKPSSVVSRQ